MICPECGKEMLVIEMNDVEADCCPVCSGIWLDEGELEMISGSGKLNSSIVRLLKNPEGSFGNRACPICSAKMLIVSLPFDTPIEVDICPKKHGIWFDSGELDTIISS